MPRPSRYAHWLRGEIQSWIDDGIMDERSAAQIRQRYDLGDRSSSPSASSALARALAVVGSLLIGLGIILIFAYNWGSVPRPGKLALSFAPLAVTLALAAFCLARRADSSIWRESVSISLTLAIAACLGLVAQTLQLQSDLGQFYFALIVCSLPFLWALQSRSLFVLLCLLSICAATSTGFLEAHRLAPRFFIAAGALLAYLLLERRHTRSRFALLAFGVSTIWTFTATAHLQNQFANPLLWLCLALAIFFLWDSREALDQTRLRRHPTALLSKLGLTIVAFALSFEDAWEFGSHRVNSSPLGIVCVAVFGVVFLIEFVLRIRAQSWMDLLWAAIPLIVLALSGLMQIEAVTSVGAALFFTPYIGALGIVAIVDGYRSNSIARLNHGLAILLVLAVMRFFDSDWGMLGRGLGFIAVGILFLAANFHFLKRRKETAHAST